MFMRFAAPIPWMEVARRTLSELHDDNCLGLAAQLSFYFLLGLFPALLFLVALVGYVPLETAIADLLLALGAVAPQEFIEILRTQLAQVSEGSQAGLLTLGVMGAVWSSSAAMVAIIDALNRAFDVAEWRSWLARRLLAIVLTIALAIFIVVALVMVLVGPSLAERAADWLGLGPLVAALWSWLRWPVLISCVVVAVDLIYHFAPNRRARWAWITPGSVVATAVWIGGSFLFKFYITTFGNYAATYGAIGGAIVTMLWFYVSSLAILIGAELNAVIEDAWRSTLSLHRRDGPKLVSGEPGRIRPLTTEGRGPS
jgi:membrane protein